MGNAGLNSKNEEAVRQLIDYLNSVYTKERFSEFAELLYNKKWDQIDQHEISRAISAFLGDRKTASTIPAGTILFRARRIDNLIKDIDIKGFCVSGEQGATDTICVSGYNEANSKEPPVGISTSGRANPAYSSYLYAAEDMYTACSEIKTIQRSLISAARFQTQRNLNMIDFYSVRQTKEKYDVGNNVIMYDKLFSLIAFAFSMPNNNEDNYYLTQYIADLVRKYGYDGIVYRSFFSDKRTYVIFNCAPNYIRFIDSEIVVNYSQINTFVTFNNLKTVTVESREPDDEAKRGMKRNLLFTLRQTKEGKQNA